jgi:hypothetical protein
VVLSWDGGELPLSFAAIDQHDGTLSATVHEAVHPDAALKGQRISFACTPTAEAEPWHRDIEQARKLSDSQHWGVSKSFMREQSERWAEEGERCAGLTVAEYFQDIGLGHVYDDTWSWCAGVLSALESKAQKSAADRKEIAYYRRKIEKTELYDDMELTDYMNVLKHQDLVPAGKQVSYAHFIADQSDSSGHPKVGKATVFVSHVWKMTAKDFFEVCLAELGDDDYAWVDLYLHNQYQGAVSSIGDENSQYRLRGVYIT